MAKGNRNITWELNHSIIRDSYVKLIKAFVRKPTYDEVSVDTKLSIKTIKNHIDTLKFEPQKHPLRVLSDDVLLAIASSARSGSSASQKLWFQIMEGWTEKQVVEHQGGITIKQIDLTDCTDNELEMLEVLGMKRFWDNTKQLAEHGVRDN